MMYPYATLYVGASQNDMTPLPEPKKGGFKVLLQDVDAATTTRSADGTMLRDRLCGGATSKRKLEIEWAYLNPLDMKLILETIKDEFFYVQYPDPYTAEDRVAQFYAGDRTTSVYTIDHNNSGILWESLKVNLIEK